MPYSIGVLLFSSPLLLVLPVVTALVGIWSLLRGQKRMRPVSSLRLWRELIPGESSVRRRRFDPLWLMVLVAAILAGLALAGPRWTYPVMKLVPVTWSVRSTGATTEAWVQADADGGALLVNGTARSMGSIELRKGLAIPVSPDAAGAIHLELQTAMGGAAASFRQRPDDQPFGLIEIASAGNPIDPMLHRVFAIQAGARLSDPTVRPRVLLVSAAGASPEDLADVDLVIALPPAALPGLTPGGRVERAAAATLPWTPVAAEHASGGAAWPAIVPLKDVHITALRQAAFDNTWEVAAEVPTSQGAMPLVLVRTVSKAGSQKALWVWLAAAPTTETDWFKSPGFVVYFMQLQQRTFGMPAGPAEWVGQPEPAKEPRMPTDLRPWLALAGIVLLVCAAGWFVRRSN